MTVQNPAPGYPCIIPYLKVATGKGDLAIAYYTKHFGAKERMRLPMKDKNGQACIGHSELMFGDSMIMVSDFGDIPTDVQSIVQILVAVDNIDQVFAGALADGATEIMALQDMFYGDRSGVLKDPFGHVWHLTQHIRDVSEEEMRTIMDKMQAQ